MLAGILVPLGFFAMITAIVLVTARYRNRERMEAIRNGMALFPVVPGRGALLWGLVLTLGGMGYGVGVLALDFGSTALMGAAVAVPIGIALLVYHRLTQPDRQKAEQLCQAAQLRQDTSAAFPSKPKPADAAGRPST